MKKYCFLLCLGLGILLNANAQNYFPLYSSGNYTGGSGDYTNISNAQLELQSPNGYVRVAHISNNAIISAVYNFQTGKNVYWGEPSDLGKYVFRGRDLLFQTDVIGEGDYSDGNGDYTNIERPTMRFRVDDDYVRIPYLSGNAIISTVYNYESGKNVYWGEPSDLGNYVFRGRDLLFQSDITGEGDYSDGNGDFTNIQRPTLRFRVDDDYVRIPYLSGNAVISTVYNYESGKNIYWGEPSDQGNYYMRGRNFIVQNGNMGIGVSSPTNKLEVNGAIRSEEVIVEILDGPDYVFEPDYKLRTLEEIKKYIAQHKHLPEIPSAKEMKENGVGLADMNMKLLKKIEELTLYQIELLERLEQQSAELQHVKKELQTMNK